MWFKKSPSKQYLKSHEIPPFSKSRTIDKGGEIEKMAEIFLKKKGLRPVTHNYHTRAGEIDLIMKDGQVLVFIEVRYRKSESHGSGAESITSRKQQRLTKAARHYLMTHYGNAEPDCRFDVISATGEPVFFEWIKNAF